jgi:arylsulfatase A-like enzyme
VGPRSCGWPARGTSLGHSDHRTALIAIPLAPPADLAGVSFGGETTQWYPDLAEDNHYIDQPYGPEDGYHLSKDLADKALSFIHDSKSVGARQSSVG